MLTYPPLSVAIYMHDFAGGGVERMRLTLIDALRTRGVQVTLIVQQAGGPLLSLVPNGVEVIALGSGRTLNAVIPLARVIRSLRPDVLMSSLNHNNVTALLAKMLFGRATSLVICQHNTLSAERGMGWRYAVVPLIFRAFGRLAAGIVCVSHGVADDFTIRTGIDRSRISVIHNPVVDPGFAQRASTAAPHAWFTARDRPVFVAVGRLVDQKDPLTLLEAFRTRLADAPARLIIVGEGPLGPALLERTVLTGIAEHVCFVGFAANPLPWIAQADALILTSRYEGFGNVLVEALACGTPVVASNCPHGPAEILCDGRYGALVQVGDTAGFAAALAPDLRTRWDPDLLKARGLSFTASACAAKHMTLFSQIQRAKPSHSVFGLFFTRSTAKQIADRVMVEPAVGVSLVVTPNLDHIRMLQQPSFAAAYSRARLVCADGFPVAIYAWLRGGTSCRRVTGCDLFHELANHPGLNRQKCFVIVESQATADALIEWSAQRSLQGYVQAHVAAPDFGRNPLAQRAIAGFARDFGTTVLVMTLGAPISELFVDQHRAELPPCWALCVGQAVRVELTLARRAPGFWQTAGLEWLWRVVHEPRRLVGRYARALYAFPRAIACDLAGRAQTSLERRE